MAAGLETGNARSDPVAAAAGLSQRAVKGLKREQPYLFLAIGLMILMEVNASVG